MESNITRKSTNYGGIPYTHIMQKLEETDMGEYDNDEYDDNGVEYKYRSLARSEIIDRNPDKPAFEADQARRNPTMSRQKLNLQYNSTRGNSAELPSHPEMFMGFMDADPRGTMTDPRLEKMRDYMTGAKAARMQVPMGNNDDNLIVERPMTNMEIDENRKRGHLFTRQNLKVFSRDRLGQGTNNNGMNTNYRRGHFETGDNTIHYENFREMENYKSNGKPDDNMMIYNKVDNDYAFKQQVLMLNNKSREFTSDLARIQHQVQQEVQYAEHHQQANASSMPKTGEITRLKFMSEQMQLLHSQITALNTTSATPQKISQAKYLTDQMQALGSELKTMNFRSANKEDGQQIRNYIDHMMTLQNSIQQVNNKAAVKVAKQVSRPTQHNTDQSMSSEHYTTKYKAARIDAKQIHNYSEMNGSDNLAADRGSSNKTRVEHYKTDITKTIIDNITADSTTDTTKRRVETFVQKRVSEFTKLGDGHQTMNYRSAVKKSGFITGENDIQFQTIKTAANNKQARQQIRNNYLGDHQMTHGETYQTPDKLNGVLPKSLRREQMRLD